MSQQASTTTTLTIQEHISSDLHFHTVRVFFNGDETLVGIGVAAKSPGDKYNANIGYRLALKRALNDLMNNAKPKKGRRVKPQPTDAQLRAAAAYLQADKA